MVDSKELEERIIALERDVAAMKRAAATDLSRNWVERISGSMRDYPEFDEVIALGKEARQADRPPEAASDAA